MKQLNFEIQYANHNVTEQLNGIKDDLLEPCMLSLLSQISAYEVERVDQVEIANTWDNMDLTETMWKCISAVFAESEVTVQQLLGMFWHTLDLKIGQRKARVMEPFFLALTASPLIEMKKRGVEFVFFTEVELDKNEYGYILPSLDMPIVESNEDIGYKTLKEHVITGHKLKQHSKEVCLDHINRLNSVGYRVETRLLFLHKPVFDSEPKMVKKTGKLETPIQVQKRKEAFKHYAESLPDRIRIMVQQGNKFHFCHRYDTRLRTYVKAHHFDYIGQKYSRALTQPIIGELTEGTYEYF